MICQRCENEISLLDVAFCPFCGEPISMAAKGKHFAVVACGHLEASEEDLEFFFSYFGQLLRKHGGLFQGLGKDFLFFFQSEQFEAGRPIRALSMVQRLRQEAKAYHRDRGRAVQLRFGLSYGEVFERDHETFLQLGGQAVERATLLCDLSEQEEVWVSQDFADLFDSLYRFVPIPVDSKRWNSDWGQVFRFEGGEPISLECRFVGRNRELLELETRLQGLAQKRGFRTLLLGEAGVGKSRLLKECGRRVPREILVFQTRFERTTQVFPGVFQSLAKTILPLLSKGPNHLPISGSILMDEKLWANFNYDQVKQLFRATLLNLLEHQPCLICFEDLHFADRSSLCLLKDLMEDLEDYPMGILATSRQKCPYFSDVVEISPLNEKESTRLFQECGGTEEQIEQKYLDFCQGNPFFVQEMARHLEKGLSWEKLKSGSIRLLLEASLNSLPSEERSFIELLSLYGGRANLKILSQILGWNEEKCVDIADKNTLCLRQGEDFFIRHDMLRELADEQIEALKKKKLHYELAQVMASLGEPIETVAHHYFLSGDPEKGASASLKAAWRYLHLDDAETAAQWLSRGRRFAIQRKDSALLFEAGAIQFKLESLRRTVEESLKWLDAWNEKEGWKGNERSEFHLLKGEFLFDRGRIMEALQELETVGANESHRSFKFILLKGKILAKEGKHREAVKLSLQEIREPSRTDEEKAELYSLLGYVSFLDREYDQAVDFYEKSYVHFQMLEHMGGMSKVEQNLGNTELARGELNKARTTFLKLCESALQRSDLSLYASNLLRLGSVNFDLLRLRESEANHSQALSISSLAGNKDLYFQICLSQASAERFFGDLKPAMEKTREVLAYSQKTHRVYLEIQATRLMAKHNLDLGCAQEALNLLETLQKKPVFPSQDQLNRMARVEALLALERDSDARKELKLFEEKYPKEKRSILAQMEYLSWVCVLEKGISDELQTYLQSNSETLPLYRLSLLAKVGKFDLALVQAKGKNIVSRIEQELPEKSKKAFLSRPDVQLFG